jgi:hypothetical protein
MNHWLRKFEESAVRRGATKEIKLDGNITTNSDFGKSVKYWLIT